MDEFCICTMLVVLLVFVNIELVTVKREGGGGVMSSPLAGSHVGLFSEFILREKTKERFSRAKRIPKINPPAAESQLAGWGMSERVVISDFTTRFVKIHLLRIISLVKNDKYTKDYILVVLYL